MISISEIQKNPYQPRKEFDVEKLKELAQSIKENGLIQPIIVRQSPVIGYEILAGERRYRASLLAGLTSIPAVVKHLSDQEMMIQSIIENLQRENLNPVEEARAYESLVEKGFTHTEIADKMGKSRPYITNFIRLLSLPEYILTEVENGKIDSFIKDEEDKLKKLLGLSVEIKLSKKDTGKIIISFSSQEEYDRIINSLK